MEIKAVIFDMDGTMFDTEQLSIDSWIYSGKQFGLDIPMELMLSVMGLNTQAIADKFTEELGDKVDYYDFRERKIEYETKRISEEGVPIKPGLFELLDLIKKKGIKCAVATSTSSMRALPILEAAGVLKYFDAIVCGDQIEKGKPAPDIFLMAAEQLSAEPKHCIAIEDSRNGILSAKAAEMVSILIPDKIAPTQDMLNAADYVFKSLEDVIKLLEEE